MSDILIVAENLSKSYLVGHQSAQRERYIALRDVIVRATRNFARKAVDLAHGRQTVPGDEVEEFWALRDVSFEVKQGEVIGIIGYYTLIANTLNVFQVGLTEGKAPPFPE